MAKFDRHNTRWADADDNEVGDLVVATVQRIAENQSHRRDAAKLWLGAYLGRCVSDLDGRVYSTSQGKLDGSQELTVRVAQSVIDTAVAKIASKQRPKPTVLTTTADYRTRLRAKKLSQFLLAQLHQRHGQFSNAWALGEAIFRDACLGDAGVIKVRADESEGRVVYERCFSYDLFADDQEARDGCPRNLFHRYPYDRSTLEARFPECKEAIAEAAPWRPEDGAIESDADQVAVYEAWRLPYSQDLPGRHVIAVKSASGLSTLVDEDWTHPTYPFAILRLLPNQYGIWGQPMIDQIVEPQAEMQAAYASIQQNIEALGGGYIDVVKGAYEMSHLQSNAALKILERNVEIQTPAVVHLPNALNQSVMQWAQHLRDLCFELSGINQMGSMGRKEPGIDSGVAIRSMNDLQGERFLPMSRAYEQLFVDLGSLTLQAMTDLEESLGEDNKSISTVFPHDGFLSEIKWEDVRLDDQMYRVSIEPASSFPDTLAGRLQLLSELAQSSWISPEAAKRLTMAGSPDLESLQRREDSQHRYIERLISQFQESDEDDEVYRAPDPLLPSIPLAMAEFANAYVEMLSDDAPEFNLELMRRWIVDADRLLQKQQEPPLPPPGAAPAPPEAAPPPADPAAMMAA